MEVIIWCAEGRLDLRPDRCALQGTAVVPAPLVDGERPHADPIEGRLEAEADQEAGRVGADLDAGADLADGGCLLVYMDVEPGFQQMQIGRDLIGDPADFLQEGMVVQVKLHDGEALYDKLGPWFTLLCFGGADPSPLIDASPAPLTTVMVDDPDVAPIYEAKLVLVRPDTHVAWRGDVCDDGRALWHKVLQ